MNSLITPGNHFTLWAVLLASVAFGLYGEKKKWFGSIAGVVVTIILMSLLAMFHVVPSASNDKIEVPVYDFIFKYLIPIAIPLLLFNANLVKIVKESGRLIIIYLLGALGIVIGAIISFYIVNLGQEGFKVAGVFIATLVGGSVNFVAAAETLDFSTSSLFATTIAVDNFFIHFYIVFLFIVPFLSFLKKYFPDYTEENETEAEKLENTQNTAKGDLESITYSLSIAAIVAALGFWLTPVIKEFFHTKINITILVITLIITLAANIFPETLRKFEKTAFSIGMFFLYVFLAVVGAAANPKDVLLAGPEILLFAFITVVIQFILLLIFGKIFKFSLKEIAVASCANVGGPATAVPMAATFKMRKAITPAVLVGILGYVIGTILGVSVGFWLQ
jgi:uncharacterized membrane protein